MPRYEETIINVTTSVGEKIAIEVTFEYLAVLTEFSKGHILKRVLNDRILLDMKALVVEHHNKYFDLVDRKLQQFFESGILRSYYKDIEDIFNAKKYEELKNHAALTFEDLEAGFVICFVPLLFCIAMFGFEWSVVLKDYIVFRCIFGTLFKILRK